MGQWVSNNHNDTVAYAGSALPFCTGSFSVADGVAKVIEFPYVTRFIQIFNNNDDGGDGLRVGFTKSGTQAIQESGQKLANYFVIPADQSSARLEVKCTEIWLAGDGGAVTCSVVAGYTGVPKTNFVGPLTGSEGFRGIG